jgi:hypothetical protein
MNESVLIVFRGGCSRVNNPALICKNIDMQILRPLRSRVNVDIIFSTTSKEDPTLQTFNSLLRPIEIFYTSSGQIVNFQETLMQLQDKYLKYTHILFLRFEIIYKVSFDTLNILDTIGIRLPYKEDSQALFDSHKYYGDCIIVVSRDHFANISKALLDADFNTISTGYGHDILHRIVSVILASFPETPVSCILDGFFQSNTNYPADNIKLNPLYILTHYPYCGDKSYLLDINHYTTI